MTYNDLVEHFGSSRQVQEALGISKQLASYWKRAGIPIGRQYEIQVLTGGKFRADQAHRMSQPDKSPADKVSAA
jgi:transcriptional repressor of cell division inhibition gene dicB